MVTHKTEYAFSSVDEFMIDLLYTAVRCHIRMSRMDLFIEGTLSQEKCTFTLSLITLV